MKQRSRSSLALWPFAFGFRVSFWLSALSTILLLLAAVVPALNVVVVKMLSTRLVAADGSLAVILLAGVLFGFSGALQQGANTVSRLNALRITVASAQAYDHRLATSPARSYTDGAFLKAARMARQSVDEAHMSSQFQAVGNICCAVLTAGTLCAALWAFSPTAALISLVAPIPTSIAFAWYGRKESQYWPEASEHSRRARYLQDQLSYQHSGLELAMLNASGGFEDLASASRRTYARIRQRLELMALGSDSLAGVTTVALFCASLMFLYRDSGQDLSAVFSGIVGLMGGVSAMSGIGYQIGELAVSMPANRHLRDFLEKKTPVRGGRELGTVLERAPHDSMSAQAPHDSTSCRGRRIETIEVRDLTVRYGDLRAVENAHVSLERGTLCALVGENGSGKTSLLRALMSLQQDADGEIVIDGRRIPVACLTQDDLPFISVQQDFGRYEVSVRDFLTLGWPARAPVSSSTAHVSTQTSTTAVDAQAPTSAASSSAPHTDTDLWNALEAVEARDMVERLPQKLDSLLGEQWGGTNISGGQWQRLAIARAFLRADDVWFLDEPTSAIDAPTEQRIFDRLALESRNRIVLLTSHRVSTLRSAGRIYVIDRGRIVERGSFDQLVRPGTRFRELFESQLDVE